MAKNTGKKTSSGNKEKEGKKGFLERLKSGFKNTVKQLKAVSWPNAEKTKRNTGTVLGVILIFALTIFIFDKAIALFFEATGFYGADAKKTTPAQKPAPVTKDVLEEAGITVSTEKPSEESKASEAGSGEGDQSAKTEETSGN